MDEAIKQCIRERRQVTVLRTLSAEVERFCFYWRILMCEFTKPVRILLGKVGES